MAGIRGSADFVSVVGYRFFESLAYGKLVKIDDLVTLPEARGQGHGGRLIDYVRQEAVANQCASIHLDTGYTRHLAHRLYLDKGFEFSCHHLALRLNQ